MELTENKKKRIKAKLTAAMELMAEAYYIVRESDINGESDLAVHIDSVRNDIDDTIDILKNA